MADVPTNIAIISSLGFPYFVQLTHLPFITVYFILKVIVKQDMKAISKKLMFIYSLLKISQH